MLIVILMFLFQLKSKCAVKCHLIVDAGVCIYVLLGYLRYCSICYNYQSRNFPCYCS